MLVQKRILSFCASSRISSLKPSLQINMSDYYLTTVLENSQRTVEPLRRNSSIVCPDFSEICAESLKALQLQGFPFVCQKTPTLKAAGSNPVGRTITRKYEPCILSGMYLRLKQG